MKNNVYISECCWGYPESFSTKFCGFRLSLNYQDGSEKNAFCQADLNHSLFSSRSVRARRLQEKKKQAAPKQTQLTVTTLTAVSSSQPYVVDLFGQTEGQQAVIVYPQVTGPIISRDYTEGALVKKATNSSRLIRLPSMRHCKAQKPQSFRLKSVWQKRPEKPPVTPSCINRKRSARRNIPTLSANSLCAKRICRRLRPNKERRKSRLDIPRLRPLSTVLQAEL